MRTTFSTQSAASLQVTMELTLNLGEWKSLKDQLLTVQRAPCIDLAARIGQMVTHYEQTIHADARVSDLQAQAAK